MDNLIDVEKDQMEILRKIINRHVPGKEIWAYGSRVTRKAEAFSDLDLVVFDRGFKFETQQVDQYRRIPDSVFRSQGIFWVCCSTCP